MSLSPYFSPFKLRPILIISVLVGSFLLPTATSAFVILPEPCRQDEDKCLKSQSLEWILIYGEIRDEENEFFTRLDKIWPKDKPLPPIYLDSEGGSGYVGRKIGRILRNRQATVATGNPITKLDGQQCFSACVLVALGAVKRHVRNIGIHQPFRYENYCKIDEKKLPVDADTLQEYFDYFSEMKASPELIEVLKTTPHDQSANYFFADIIEPERQDIVRWGFYTITNNDPRLKQFPVGKGSADISLVEEYQFAIDHGSRGAVQALADLYLCEAGGRRPDTTKAASVLRAAFANGNTDAGYRLASMIMEKRIKGMSSETPTAILQKLADRDHPEAQVDLALLYYSGDTVKKNYQKAISLVQSAAKKKTPSAFGALCRFYSEQLAFKRDDSENYKWCDLAIATLDSGKAKDYATEQIHKLADRMSDRQIDEAMKREIKWKSEVRLD